MGTQRAPKFRQMRKKVPSERVLEKCAPKVTHPMPLGTPSDPENDALVRAGAPFSLFRLSRKCGPKVVPLAPFGTFLDA